MIIADLQRIVDGILDILSMDSDPETAHLKDVADRYQEAVNSVNARLRECSNYLQRGLRAESLQRVTADYNVLDAVAVLDPPELPAWIDYLSQFGLPRPELLLVDVAAELNDAYLETEPLERLMQAHRLHALARSDLRTRTQILRELFQLDPQNPIWDEDVKTYEKQRILDITEQLKSAARKKDLKTVGELDEELSSTPWSVSPPIKIVRFAEETHDQLRRADARESLYELAHQLSNAYSELDVPGATRHFQKWKALLKIAELPSDDELFDLAGPALDWLGEIERKAQQDKAFSESLKRLESALESQVGRSELEHAYHQTTLLNRDLSPTLINRVMERREYLDTQSRRKSRMTIFVSVTIVLFLVTGTGLFVWHQTFNQAVAQHASQLNTLIAGDKLFDARKYIDDLSKNSPNIFSTPTLNGLGAALADAERKERGRTEAFDQIILNAKNLVQNSPTFEKCELAEKELKRPEATPKTDSEKADLAEAHSVIQSERSQLEKIVNDEFGKDLNEIQEAIRNLSKDDPNEYSAIISRLNILSQRPHVGGHFLSPLPALIEKLTHEKRITIREQMTSKRMLILTEHVGNRERFETALREYANEEAGSSRSNSFLRVVNEESRVWDGVNAWARIRRQWKQIKLKSITSGESAQMLEELNDIRKKTPYGGLMGIDNKEKVLKSIVKRELPEGRGLLDSVSSLMKGEVLHDLLVLKSSDGKRYYMSSIPEVKGSYVHVSFFDDVSMSQRTVVKLRREVVPDFRDKMSREDLISGQSRFRDDAVKLFAQPGVPWEERFNSVIELLNETKDIDPILKLQLLKRLLELASSGSLYLEKSLQDHIALINRADIPASANWMSVEMPEIDRLRRRADLVLKEFDTKAAFQEAVDLREAEQESQIGPLPQWIGWVSFDAMKIKLHIKPSLRKIPSGDLVVFHSSKTPGGTPEMEKLGIWESERPSAYEQTFTLNDSSRLCEGMPVFVLLNEE
jgi:hypothetical protein